MVGGTLRCLGSTQRLRSKYGHGFQIEFGFVVPSDDEISSQVNAFVAVLAMQNITSGDYQLSLQVDTRQRRLARFNHLLNLHVVYCIAILCRRISKRLSLCSPVLSGLTKFQKMAMPLSCSMNLPRMASSTEEVSPIGVSWKTTSTG